jgi:hypothetical protein
MVCLCLLHSLGDARHGKEAKWGRGFRQSVDIIVMCINDKWYLREISSTNTSTKRLFIVRRRKKKKRKYREYRIPYNTLIISQDILNYSDPSHQPGWKFSTEIPIVNGRGDLPEFGGLVECTLLMLRYEIPISMAYRETQGRVCSSSFHRPSSKYCQDLCS